MVRARSMPPLRATSNAMIGGSALALEPQHGIGRILDNGDVEFGGEIQQALARSRATVFRPVGLA